LVASPESNPDLKLRITNLPIPLSSLHTPEGTVPQIVPLFWREAAKRGSKRVVEIVSTARETIAMSLDKKSKMYQYSFVLIKHFNIN
jgi:hypothetical protein